MIEHERTGILDYITLVFSRFAMWAPAFVVAIMCYEVVMRYIFIKPTLWVNELSLWVGGGIYLTSGLYAMQQRSHIRIVILYDIVPRGVRRFFDMLSALFIWLFAGAVIWGGFGEAYDKLMRWERFGTAWDPPIPGTVKPLVLLVLVVIAAQVLSNLVHDWNREPVRHDRTMMD